jgi:hypothetical protein
VKTPTLSADLSDKGNSYHAHETCEGVKEKQEDIISIDEEEEILLYNFIKTKPIHNIQIEDMTIYE